MPHIPTETLISAAILAALIAGWRYVQQNPQQEVIPASIKKTAQSVLPGGKGLFEDELTGESSSKSKSSGKKSSGSKKKKQGGAGSTAAAAVAAVTKAISETEREQDSASTSTAEAKSTKQKKPQTLAEKKVKKAPKTEVDDMLPDDQKQPQLARVMKIVPESTSSSSYSAVAAPTTSKSPATSAPAVNDAQSKSGSSSDEGRQEDFGYEDEDESEEEVKRGKEDGGWERPKKFVGGANGNSFANAAASSRAPSAPTLNRFSLLTENNPNFQTSSSSRRRTTNTTSRSSQPETSSTPTKIQRKNANKRDAQKAQKEQEERERLDRLKSYRAEAAKERAGAGGKKDALGRGVENWSSQRDMSPYPPPLPITLDSVVWLLRKTIFNLSFANTIQFGFLSWQRFAPATWKNQIDFDRFTGLQVWLKPYRYGIPLWCAYVSAKVMLAGQIFPERIKWKEQIVVVTGGASGIGALLVQALAKRGAKVVVLDINQAEKTTDLVSSYICDVSDYSQVQTVAERVRDEVGSPTVLVNNAGVVAGKMILDLQERDVQRTFGVNVLSQFWTIKVFLPDMLRSEQGHIVTVSSVLGLAGSARMTDYCASKAALITMHDALRFELTNRYHAPGVKTTLLLPGHIRTPLFDRIQFPRSLFFRFMAPSLEPEEVVAGIMTELEYKRNGVIRMPFYTQAVRFLNIGTGLVPGFMRNFLQWLSQADYAMDSYN